MDIPGPVIALYRLVNIVSDSRRVGMFLVILTLTVIFIDLDLARMATAHPIEAGNGDNYELELSRVRENIKTKFVELIDCLKARESELLRELDNILASHLSYRSELEKVNERKRDLEITKSFHQNKFLTSPNKSFHETCIAHVITELKSIKIPIEPKMISFECDSNKMLAELNKLGKLVEKVRSGIDYKSKKQPLLSVCERGNGMEQLNYPRGVTVDNRTGNIYIADHDNHCVKVFDSTGKYLFKFGDNEGEGKMFYPRGVAIYENRIIITQGNNCILNYQLNGKFVSRIGGQGRGELEFRLPFGLTIDESNGDIYICDNNNNRIQILNNDLSFKSQFGKDTLKYPRDVKLSKEYIYVLDESNPCLHLFSYNHMLQKSVISRGKGMEVINPYFFFVDQTENILISDLSSNSIHIFNTEFQLIHKIPVSNNPTGVTVDKQGRVIVVSLAVKDCLQIF